MEVQIPLQQKRKFNVGIILHSTEQYRVVADTGDCPAGQLGVTLNSLP